MSVRITSIAESTETVIHVAGKLRTEDVGELEREASGVMGPWCWTFPTSRRRMLPARSR